MDKNYITYAENVDDRYHRSHWIIHNNSFSSNIKAEFNNKDQPDIFAKTLGFTYELVEEYVDNQGGKFQRYTMDKNIVEPFGYGGFWKLEDLPDGVKPIKALSNGSIVTCYYRTMDDRIEFYRPNPNAKEVYKPLDIELHIAHQKIYGSY